MPEKIYKDEYTVFVKLADLAWSNLDYFRRVQSGELENIISETPGVRRSWNGLEEKYQNVVTVDNPENAFILMNKLNSLPYVKEISLIKEGLRPRNGFIPVSKK